jgi:hypothetical protein
MVQNADLDDWDLPGDAADDVRTAANMYVHSPSVETSLIDCLHVARVA